MFTLQTTKQTSTVCLRAHTNIHIPFDEEDDPEEDKLKTTAETGEFTHFTACVSTVVLEAE